MYIQQKLTEQKGEVDISTMTDGDSNTSLPITHRTSGQMQKTGGKGLKPHGPNGTFTAEYTFISGVHGTVSVQTIH